VSALLTVAGAVWPWLTLVLAVAALVGFLETPRRPGGFARGVRAGLCLTAFAALTALTVYGFGRMVL
jgi:hypothetical protein